MRPETVLLVILFFSGHISSLWLMLAGKISRYSHWSDLTQILQHPWILILLALELAVALAVLFRNRFNFVNRILDGYKPYVWASAILVTCLTGVTPSPQPADYLGEMFFNFLMQLIHFSALFAIISSITQSGWNQVTGILKKMFFDKGNHCGYRDSFVWWVAILAAVLAVVLNLFSYQNHPHIPDEVVYLIHSRYLSGGMLALPLPEVSQAFNVDLMFYDQNRWFSPVPVGWPALLSLGWIIGLPWLVNPVLGGLNVLLMASLFSGLTGKGGGRLAALLTAFSPWHLFLSMSFMTHTSSLFFALCGAVLLEKTRRNRSLFFFLFIGLSIGFVSLIRPLEGLAIALILGITYLGMALNTLKVDFAGHFARIGLMIAGAAFIGGLTLPYNKALTGKATYFPIMMYCDKYYGPGSNSLGFGPEKGFQWPQDPFAGHGWRDVIVNSLLNISATQWELFGWAGGSLLFVFLFVFRGRFKKIDLPFFVTIIFVTGLHSFYWFSGGPDFGARYWFLIFPACIWFIVRSTGYPDKFRPGILQAVLSMLAIGLFIFVPWRSVDKYYHYRGMHPGMREVLKNNKKQNKLFLIQGERHPDYASAVVYNSFPFDFEKPVIAWQKDSLVIDNLKHYYPGREIIFLKPASDSRPGFEAIPAKKIKKNE